MPPQAKADRLIESKTLSFENALVTIKDLDLNLPRPAPIGDESAEDFVYKVLGFVRLSKNMEGSTLLISVLNLQVLDTADDLKVQTTFEGQFPIEDTPECHVNPTPTHWPVGPKGDSDNWRYTSLLWEEAQARGRRPNIEETCINSFPPMFRVTIECMGTKASGEGRTKKLAKHLAAKHVCKTLGLQPC